jgi:hypothetical protein
MRVKSSPSPKKIIASMKDFCNEIKLFSEKEVKDLKDYRKSPAVSAVSILKSIILMPILMIQSILQLDHYLSRHQ